MFEQAIHAVGSEGCSDLDLQYRLDVAIALNLEWRLAVVRGATPAR